MAKRGEGTLYRCHLFSFGAPQTEGVTSVWAKDLQPIGDREVKTGELVEMLVEVASDSYRLNENTRVRYDVLEEDYSLTGGYDDLIVSYVGTGASPHPDPFPIEHKKTLYKQLAADETLLEAVNSFKRDNPAVFYDYIVIFERDGELPTYYIIAWWEARRLEDYLDSEYYFIVNIDDVFEDKSEEIINVTDEPVGKREVEPRVRLRIRGRVLDRYPTDYLIVDNLKDTASLALKLKDEEGTLAQHLKGLFPNEPAGQKLLELLRVYDGKSAPSQDLKSTLAAALNEVLSGESIYEEARFTGIELSEETRNLAREDPQREGERRRLNRLLLQEAYSDEIAPPSEEPIFDIEVRAGQQTTRASLFSIDNLRESGAQALAVRLENASEQDPVSLFLRSEFHKKPDGRRLLKMLRKYREGDPLPASLRSILVDCLNEVLQGKSIYQEERFSGYALSDDIWALVSDKPRGEHLIRFNRLLLEEVYSSEITRTEDGKFVLDGLFTYGSHGLEIGRQGVETLTLQVSINHQSGDDNEQPEGQARQAEKAQIAITSPVTNAEIPSVTRQKLENNQVAVDVDLLDLKVIVHKLCGTVFWPDSLNGAQEYPGTRLAGKRVYILPLEEGEIGLQRPSTSKAWADLKYRRGVHRSGRPGCFNQGQRTDHSGNFEIKFIDLSIGSRYFIWAESLDPDSGVEIPDYTVRIFHKQLRELNGDRANLARNVGRHLIDHTYNLTSDPVTWGIESFTVVNWLLSNGNVEVRVARPQLDRPHRRLPVNKHDYDTDARAGETEHANGSLIYDLDNNRKMISNFRLLCLPLVPIFESVDQQAQHARLAKAGLAEDMDIIFPRGHLAESVRFVLDARRIDSGIDLPAGALHRRRCELLERTFMVSPQLPNRHLNCVNSVDAAHWVFDAITLADFALISIPQSPPLGRAVIANRRLDSDWVPIMQPVRPRILGLSAGRHLFLSPGHGFYDTHPGGNASTNTNPQLGNWASPKGGWNRFVGEDHNDGYIGMEVADIARKNRMKVTSVREDRDMTRLGVVHPGQNQFNVPANFNPNFLRLWQQNPIYYLGFEWQNGFPTIGDVQVQNSIANSFNNNANLGQVQVNQNGRGIDVRKILAEQLIASASPIDIYLAIHTNAVNGLNRGVLAFYTDVRIARNNAAEFNTFGQRFARSLQTEISNRSHLHLRRRDPDPYRRPRIDGTAELRDVFDYWYRNGDDSRTWTRVRQNPTAQPNPSLPIPGSQWQHKDFRVGNTPRDIPMAYPEVGFHDNRHDAALLYQAWFRRLIGEAMAFAVEDALRHCPDPTAAEQRDGAGNIVGTADPPNVTRAEIVKLLTETFGPTQRISRFTSDGIRLSANDVQSCIRRATATRVRHVPAVANSQLNAVVTAIESARDSYTREDFVKDLRNILAEKAGYEDAFLQPTSVNSTSEIDQFVTGTILNGDGIGNLSRGGKPITRAEAAGFLATALGWLPANLNTVTTRSIGGITLMQQLNNADHPQKFVPEVEAMDIMVRIRNLNPELIYQISALYLADESYNRLTPSGDENRFTIRVGSRVTIVAETKGIPWKANIRDIHFSVSNFGQKLKAALRERHRLGSEVWEVPIPTNGESPRVYTISVSMEHRTEDGRVRKHEKNIIVSFLPRDD